MQLDPAVYRYHLDASEMSEEAKIACMETVWAFLSGEFDRQCGDAPEQILLGIRGRKATHRPVDPLGSVPALNETYNDAARGAPARKSLP